MADDEHGSIDLVTLEEVHRLLRDTDFASADELGEHLSVDRLDAAIARQSRQGVHTAAMATDPDAGPLPRRR